MGLLPLVESARGTTGDVEGCLRVDIRGYLSAQSSAIDVTGVEMDTAITARGASVLTGLRPRGERERDVRRGRRAGVDRRATRLHRDDGAKGVRPRERIQDRVAGTTEGGVARNILRER